jgi:hypothetical protein
MTSQNRIRFHDWTLYDGHHAVFQPARLSLFDLQKAQDFCHKKFYSLKQTIKKLFAGQWIGVGIAHYARGLNRMWRRRNKTFLRVVDLLKSKPGTTISVDYREEINLSR